MGRPNQIFTVLIASLLCFCMSCSRSQEKTVEDEPAKAKRLFVNEIEHQFQILKDRALNVDGHGCRFEEKIFNIPAIYMSRYPKYVDKHTYDIQKTDSIVTPYMGTVTFYYDWYVKRGETMERCESVIPELVGSYKVNYTYAYQDGIWVLKRKTDEMKEKFGIPE